MLEQDTGLPTAGILPRQASEGAFVIGERIVPSNPIRVLVVDAHAGVREAIATFVEANEDMELVGEAAGSAEAIGLCDSVRPDVALVGITLQGQNGIGTIAAIRRRCPETRILAMGSFQEEEQRQVAIEAGAVGYLLKYVSADELGAAIRAAYAAGSPAGIVAALDARVQKQKA